MSGSWPASVCRRSGNGCAGNPKRPAEAFGFCNYLTHKCNMCRISWKRSIRRGKVGVCHPQFETEAPLCGSTLHLRARFPLAAHNKCKVCNLGEIQSGVAAVNVAYNWTSSSRRNLNEDSGEFLIFTDRWHRYSSQLSSRERDALCRLMASLCLDLKTSINGTPMIIYLDSRAASLWIMKWPQDH